MNTFMPAPPTPKATDPKVRPWSNSGLRSGPACEAQLEALYELMNRGPMSESGRSIRVLFLESERARGLLLAHLCGAVAEELYSAPVLMLLAELRTVHAIETAVRLGDEPPRFAKPGSRFALKRELYILMAARSVGLDAGPMSLLDDVKLDAAFFPDGSGQVTAFCGVGRDPSDPERFSRGLTPRSHCAVL